MAAGGSTPTAREANRTDAYQSELMEPASDNSSGTPRFSATIPSAYTDSPYPLIDYFCVRLADGSTAPYLGFDPSLASQPYYLIR